MTLDTRKRSTAIFAQDPAHDLYSPRVSDDGKWAVFHAITGHLKRKVFVAPVRSGQVAYEQRIAVTDGSALDREAVWDPNGSAVYFLSERDGWRCVWSQPLDRLSKRPAGRLSPYLHFHSARRSLRLGDTASVGLSIAGGWMMMTLNELTGNVWMLQFGK
jgi:Tol biopolymer transport system component